MQQSQPFINDTKSVLLKVFLDSGLGNTFHPTTMEDVSQWTPMNSLARHHITCVSEECIASIFRVEGIFLFFPLYPEYGGDMFLRNVG
jgi:hypothetical protein